MGISTLPAPKLLALRLLESYLPCLLISLDRFGLPHRGSIRRSAPLLPIIQHASSEKVICQSYQTRKYERSCPSRNAGRATRSRCSSCRRSRRTARTAGRIFCGQSASSNTGGVETGLVVYGLRLIRKGNVCALSFVSNRMVGLSALARSHVI